MENLEICIKNLDKKVNESETLREFISNSEKEFNMTQADIDNMADLDLQVYVDFLDYLWEK